MSTKKILAVLLALFVLATAVSGCGNSGSSSADSQSGSSATSENSASSEDTASTDGEVPTISLMVVCGTTPPPFRTAQLSTMVRPFRSIHLWSLMRKK